MVLLEVEVIEGRGTPGLLVEEIFEGCCVTGTISGPVAEGLNVSIICSAIGRYVEYWPGSAIYFTTNAVPFCIPIIRITFDVLSPTYSYIIIFFACIPLRVSFELSIILYSDGDEYVSFRNWSVN